MLRNPKSRIRMAWLFGILMAIGVSLIFYLPIISTTSLNEDTKELAEEQIAEKEEEARQKAAVPGDVLDCNGEILVTSDENGNRVYADDVIYSNLLGYSCNGKKDLLLGNLDSILREPEGGTDKGDMIKLTLDSHIQEYAYNLLSSSDQLHGSIVVLDAKTGAIVAMASNPSYSISSVLSNDGIQPDEDIKNYVTDPLLVPTRPGSIFKLVTSTGILENHLENTKITDNGSYKFKDGTEIHDCEGEPDGEWDFTNGLIHSSNVYFGRMTAEHLGWNVMDDLAERFKVGEQNMVFEFGTMNSTYESSATAGYDRSTQSRQLAQVGYGYADLQLTALQAAMITQTVANKGTMCMPYLLDDVYKTTGISIGNGKYEYEYGEKSSLTPAAWQKGSEYDNYVMSEEVAAKIRDAMVATAVNKSKTHKVAGLSEDGITVNGSTYSLAIKTGTADLKEDGSDNNIWMVSFAPADDPQYVVVVNRFSAGKKYGISLLSDVVSMYQELFSEK